MPPRKPPYTDEHDWDGNTADPDYVKAAIIAAGIGLTALILAVMTKGCAW